MSVIEKCLAVEVWVTGDDCLLADVSRAAGTTLGADPPQRRADGNALLRFSRSLDDHLVTELDAETSFGTSTAPGPTAR